MGRRLRAVWPDLPAAAAILSAAALGSAFFLAGRLSVTLISHDSRLAPVWIANAVALAALLRSERRRWPWLIAACLAGNLATSLSTGNSLIASGCMAVGNGVEFRLSQASLR